MSPLLVDFMRHIRDECDYVIDLTNHVTFEELSEDPTLRRASAKSIEIMGEAIKKIPPHLLAARPGVPWKQFARMRDRLSHGYFDVDYQVIWDVFKHYVPDLRAVIDEMIVELDSQSKGR